MSNDVLQWMFERIRPKRLIEQRRAIHTGGREERAQLRPPVSELPVLSRTTVFTFAKQFGDRAAL